MIRLPRVRSIWKVIFAITALIEMQYITLLMRKENVNESENNASQLRGRNSEPDEYCRSTLVYYEEDEFSINYTYIDRAWESTLTISKLVFVWIGPFFCFLCLVEALVRAVEARHAARDSRALDELENTLLQAAQKSSIKLSMFFTSAAADQGDDELEVKVTRRISKVLRSFIPAISTIAFWLFILPTDLSDFHHRCGSEHLHDSAVVTQWIYGMSLTLSNLSSAFHGLLESIFWTRILPYRIHKEPQRFIQRLQVILRWIRFARFAGPLFRMVLKTQDHMRAVWKARHQSKKSDLEKRRRIDKPSLIFSDIQKLIEKGQKLTQMARVPSFSLQSSPILNKVSSSVVETYSKRREYGKQISEQLKKLQKDYLNFGGDSSDLYERIIKMEQDIDTNINSEKGGYSNRYMKSVHSFLSSRQHLISPRTRFSLAWRMTVTNCLLLEMARLFYSWHLSGTFSISMSQIVGRLLVNCKAPEQTKHHLAFITGQINQFRRHMFDMLPLFGPPPVDIAVCIPSGPQALLILQFGRMLEIFVDSVVFMDIFVWFLTGDIDVDTHAIIPKPFFTRCILPGTLVQVLDHPTLPDLLPGLLKSILAALKSIGYSRCIRWSLALIPALKMLVIDPLTAFFFEHIDEDVGFMRVAESVGMLTPERKSSTRSGLGGIGGVDRGDSRMHFYKRLSSDAFATSQVGLSYDGDSPVSSHYNLQESSLLSTEASTSMDDTVPLQHSPLRVRKSVHFGVFDHDEPHRPGIMGESESVGYSLSSHDLHATATPDGTTSSSLRSRM